MHEAAASLFESSAAMVYDTALVGATGPVLGTRYRFEAAPTLGDLSYTTLLADYRRYVMPVAPITVAARFQHVGRYGTDAGDPRLLPLIWTIRDLVRGYDAQDVLTMRRLTVANVEARIPLLGPVGLLSRVSALPLDAIVFGDAAKFWNGGTANLGAPRILRSAGAGIRFNAAGFVFEIDGAHVFDASPSRLAPLVQLHAGVLIGSVQTLSKLLLTIAGVRPLINVMFVVRCCECSCCVAGEASGLHRAASTEVVRS